MPRGRKAQSAKPKTPAKGMSPKLVVQHSDLEAQAKRERIMFLAVGFVMVFVVIIWFVNVQLSVRAVADNSDVLGNVMKSNQELVAKFDQGQELLSNLKQVGEKLATTTTSIVPTVDAASGAMAESINNTNITELNQQLKASLNISSSTINN